MDYKTKVIHAEKVADQLQQQTSVESIKANLKSEGLYDVDITKIMVSARKILGEKYQPKINEYLRAGKPIHGAEEFKLVDNEIIDTLIKKESNSIAMQEKKKITKLIKEGKSAEEVFQQVDTRFLAPEKAAEHIGRLQEAKQQNSGSGRAINIFGGIGLIVLTGILFFAAGRLFYVLPFIGLAMIAKGLVTQNAE